MDNIYISFGLLEYGNKKVMSCSNWMIHKNEMGIFIMHGDNSIVNGSLVLYSQDVEIWKSTIRKAPARDLEFDFDGENDTVFISSKVLRECDIPSRDNFYEIALFIDGEQQGGAVLSVEENREEELVSSTKPQEVSSSNYIPEEMSDITIETPIYEENYTDSLQNVEIVESQSMEKECEQTAEGEDKELENGEEELQTEFNIEESSEVQELEDYAEVSEKLDIKDCDEKEEEKVVETDLKVGLFKNLANYMPLNVSLTKDEELKTYVSMKKSIVIEKIGNFYITVLNDFSNRPAYFLYNGEQIIEWNKSFEEYLHWMKNIVCKMYNITEDEMNRIEKLLIASEEEESISMPDENITYLKRSEAIDRLVNKYSLIVDLTLDSCSIIFRDEENNKLFMETGALGIKGFINEGGIFTINKGAYGEPVNAAAQWVKHAENVFKPFANMPVMFTGMAAFPSIYEELANKFNMNSSLPFASIAWEI